MNPVLLLISIPSLAGLLVLLLPKKAAWIVSLIATALNLLAACYLFSSEIYFTLPWSGLGIDFSLRLYQFSAFIIAAAAGFGFLISLYAIAFLKEKNYSKAFYFYFLTTLGFANGAVLADNLIVLLFFWEALLLTLFGLIYIGGRYAFKTAIKAFIIIGVTDLCMMIGIGLTGYLAGTFTLSQINLALDLPGAVAFTLLMIGAISKGGSMPFHSWIPDAAIDAPLPFMAFIPAALEKLLGIYFLTRISLDLFVLTPASWVSYMLMIIGALTILLAVMMALIQKDYKRLLSYHAISQVGYMILGIGTAVPAGIVGGLFHMINNALYKSALFLTGGAVEKETGSTDLGRLGGLASRMPITFACFLITAAAISGVPPFNGFFSKELVYDGALERGLIFYLAAVAGSFFTAASFLKLGHAAYLGKINASSKNVKEAPWSMLLPMVIIALTCILFGVYNALPLNHLIQPVLGDRLEGPGFAGFPGNIWLVIITLAVLLGAAANHWFGFKRTGSGLKAADHIHHAPVLSGIYDRAEKKVFDPYDIAIGLVNQLSKLIWWCDRAIDWIYDHLTVSVFVWASAQLKKAHDGNFVNYLAWSLAGLFLTILYFMMVK